MPLRGWGVGRACETMSGVKAWIPLIIGVVALIATAGARSIYRSKATDALARLAARTSPAAARARALLWLGGCALLAAAVIAIGAWAVMGGRDWLWLRYLTGLVVLVGYAPIATLGARKMTKWQKTFDRVLVQRGAAPEPARAVAGVARVFSAIGLILALMSLFLLAPAG